MCVWGGGGGAHSYEIERESGRGIVRGQGDGGERCLCEQQQ